MSTKIEIQQASEQHAEEFAQLTITAHAQDKMFLYTCPRDRNATLAQKSEHLRWRAERIRNRMQSAGTYWFRAVDVLTGNAVGVAGVIGPHCEKKGWTNEPSEAVDEQSFMECAQMTAQKREDMMGDRGDVWCESSDLSEDCAPGAASKTDLL
jgi:hypothetical protein